MSGVPRRDRFDDLKEAYALGALSEDEREEFEDLLAAHPELQAEVAPSNLPPTSWPSPRRSRIPRPSSVATS